LTRKQSLRLYGKLACAAERHKAFLAPQSDVSRSGSLLEGEPQWKQSMSELPGIDVHRMKHIVTILIERHGLTRRAGSQRCRRSAWNCAIFANDATGAMPMPCTYLAANIVQVGHHTSSWRISAGTKHVTTIVAHNL
jgi:hypothetical protein